MAIEHVVLARFATGLSETDEAEFRRQVETCMNEIGRMRDLRLARLLPGERTGGWEYLLSMVFESEAVYDDYYFSHPKHLELAKWAADHSAELVVFNYDLEAATALRQPS